MFFQLLLVRALGCLALFVIHEHTPPEILFQVPHMHQSSRYHERETVTGMAGDRLHIVGELGKLFP